MVAISITKMKWHLLFCYFLIFCSTPNLVKSPEHFKVVCFPHFHIVPTVGLQKLVAITGLPSTPAVIIAYIDRTTVFRSYSEMNQMQIEFSWR